MNQSSHSQGNGTDSGPPTGEGDNRESGQQESTLEFLVSIFLIIVGVLAFKYTILDANNIPTGSMVPTLKVGDYLFVNKMRYSLQLGMNFGPVQYRAWDYDDPKVGDIITFDPPPNALAGGKTFVKRVIASPGDHLRLERGCMPLVEGATKGPGFRYDEIYLNGKKVPRRRVEDKSVLADLDQKHGPALGYLFKEKRADHEHYVLMTGQEACRVEDKNLLADYALSPKEIPRSFQEKCYEKKGCEIPEKHYFVVGDNRENSHDSRVWGLVHRKFIYGKVLVIYFSVNWRDNTCDIKNLESLYHHTQPAYYLSYPIEMLEKEMDQPIKKGDKDDIVRLEQWGPVEKCRRDCFCGETSQGPVSEPFMQPEGEESLWDWLRRMVSRRLWRADVRWSRLGNLIQ